jgi:cytochrome c-type biogenesis protein CcmH
MKLLIQIITLLFISNNSFALAPENHLPDEAQEQRAMNLFLQVRCLICDGQVIENSNTEFSFEMRKLIRVKIQDGESDQEIKEDLVQQFGEDILTSADISSNNFTLWILPAIFALLAAIFLAKFLRSSRNLS